MIKPFGIFQKVLARASGQPLFEKNKFQAFQKKKIKRRGVCSRKFHQMGRTADAQVSCLCAGLLVRVL